MSKKEVNDEQKAHERRLNEQCFMLANLDVFQGWGEPTGYGSMMKLKGGDPVKFITRLVARKKLQKIMDLKPVEISKLVPYIKIFKVFYESEDSTGDEYEMIFENSLQNNTVEAMMTSRTGRGSGVGIKSFEFNLLGGNPVEADRMVEAKLVLYFQSMDDLLKSVDSKPAVGTGKSKKVKYIDLIYQNKKFNKAPCTGDSTYNNKYFRIKTTVGWSAPPGADESTKAAAKTLDQASQTLFLTMTKHEIGFDDYGTATLTIDYMAAPEGVMANPKADILSDFGSAEVGGFLGFGGENKNFSRSELQGKLDSARQSKKNACKDDKEDRQEDIEKLEDLLAEVDASRYAKFLEALEDLGGIFFIDVPHDQVDAYTDSSFLGLIGGNVASRQEQIKQRVKKMREARDSNPSWIKEGVRKSPTGQFGDVKEAAKDLAKDRNDKDAKKDATKDLSEDTQTREGGGGFFGGVSDFLSGNDTYPPKNHVRINYIFLGTILHLAFVSAAKGTDLKEIRNIVGPFDYRDPISGNRRNICLADVPISLNMFKMWFFENCVIPQRQSWVLKDFLLNLIASLVQPAMGEDCFGACASGFKSRLNSRILELPLDDQKKCRISGKASVSSFGGGGTQSMEGKKITDYPSGVNAAGLESGSYLLLYSSGASTNLGPPKSGTRKDRDAKEGVYHFVIGADRGLVKKINFSRMDAPHIQASRIAGQTSGYRREAYNADVELIGNCMFVPGSLVFIDPGAFTSGGDSGTVGSAANVLGIGGYYLVVKAENFIEAGKFETKLTCKHQSFGTGFKAKVDQYCQPEKQNQDDCPDACKEEEEEAPTAPPKPDGEQPVGTV